MLQSCRSLGRVLNYSSWLKHHAMRFSSFSLDPLSLEGESRAAIPWFSKANSAEIPLHHSRGGEITNTFGAALSPRLSSLLPPFPFNTVFARETGLKDKYWQLVNSCMNCPTLWTCDLGKNYPGPNPSTELPSPSPNNLFWWLSTAESLTQTMGRTEVHPINNKLIVLDTPTFLQQLITLCVEEISLTFTDAQLGGAYYLPKQAHII